MEWDNLHELLRSLYDDMMPLAGDMAAVAKGLAGLGALFYVALKVWQALSRAEPIDMFPLLRPFALGLCIMFFPTIVLGTINAVLSPVVTGTHSILEDQVLDLNKLQQQKDQLEYEAMVRNPETAYMVSDEEFDKKLDELGWSPSDIGTMAGMYMDRGAYQIEKAIKDWFRNLLEILFQAAALVIDTIRTFFLIVLSILTDCLCNFRMGRLSVHAHAVAHEVCERLPVVACFRFVQFDAGKDTIADTGKGYSNAFRPDLYTRHLQYGVHHLYDYRHHRVLHYPDSNRLGNPSWRRRKLYPQCKLNSNESRKPCRSRSWFNGWKHRRSVT